MDYYSYYNSTGYMIFSLIFAVISIIGLWKLFEKAGEPGWASIIPFMNVYKIFKISWGNGWIFLLLLIPVVNIAIYIIMCIKFSKSFGQGTGFAVGLIFLNVIFDLILAFGDYTYIGPNGVSPNGSNVSGSTQNNY